MIQRMVRAARLDSRVYQELHDDPLATVQALWVVLLGGVALVLGEIVESPASRSFAGHLLFLTLTLASAVIEWVVLSLLAYWVARLLRRTVTFFSMLRIIGFASIPWLLSLFIGVSPGPTITLVLVWIVLMLMIAFRQTLRVSLWVSFPMAAPYPLIMLSIRQWFIQSFL